MALRSLPAGVVAMLAIAGCGDHANASGPDTLVVTPATVALITGETAQVAATFQRDGADVAGGAVTWTSSDASRATVDGRDTGATITAVAAGSATISARAGGLTATVAVAIAPAVLARIAVMPQAPSVAAGTTVQVSVIATYNNQRTSDVTSQVAWASEQPSIATASGSVLTGFLKGQTTITATYMGQVATMRVSVLDPVLQAIDVTPSTVTVVLGRTQPFTASGFFSDGTRGDITDAVAWASSDAAVATISNAAGSQGLATTLAAGQTAITATASRVTGTAMLTVEPVAITTP
jgi:uncharacterized protein YjdB